MINPVIKKIYKKIKKYNTMFIARHIGPDPDAVCSQISLRDTIKATFPSKNVYAVGMSLSRVKSFGTLDKINEEELDNPLLIVLDVPNISRIDGITFSKYNEVIKIDHHPYEDKMGDTELVDTTSCSVAQLIGELVLNTRLKLTKEVAENIFLGIVSDSDRFLLQYTTAKTFKIVNQIIEKTNLDFTNLYVRLYERPLNEIRFQGYLAQNLITTENGFAYIKITTDDIKNFGVDSSTVSNMINNFNYIKEIKVWTFITYDQKSTMYKVNIRSRNVIINDIAAKYHGGGHKFASGVRTTSEVDIDNLIKDLDERCLEVNHE